MSEPTGGSVTNTEMAIAVLVVIGILGYYYYQSYVKNGGASPTPTVPEFTVTPDFGASKPLLP